MNLKPRSFRGEEDHFNIQEFLRGRQLWEKLPDYWNTGKSTLAIYVTLFEGSPSDHRLWEDEAGKIGAYTWLSPEDRSWRILIHPEDRDTDLITQILHHAEEQLNSQLGTMESPEPLKTAAYEKDVWLTSLLETNGYVKADYLEPYLRLSLNGNIPKPTPKEGFLIREFKGESEIEQRAGAQRDSFGGGFDPNPWIIKHIGRFMRFYSGRDILDLVAISSSGTIASYAVCLTDPITKLGEFDPVGTRPSFQKRGLSRAILLSGLKYMKEKGMRNAVVRTDCDNYPAIKLYQSVGFTVVDRLYRYIKNS